MTFDYNRAFSRNLGLVTADEQIEISKKTIAIADMGGVGGVHLLTLARMGFQKFHIADMDRFEVENFNRQVGASMSTVGKEKAEVMRQKVLDINPQAEIVVFSKGVDEDNLEEFLDGVDVYLDGLDFFVLDIRKKLFQRAHEKGIYAVTAGPIGVSTAFLVFDPKGMSFEEYFQFEKAHTQHDKAVHFLLGISPKISHRKHIVDNSTVRLNQKKGPSLSVSCQAASAAAGAEILKIVLGRGKVNYVPWAQQLDLYENKYHKTYNWMGNKSPINRIKLKIVKRILRKKYS